MFYIFFLLAGPAWKSWTTRSLGTDGDQAIWNPKGSSVSGMAGGLCSHSFSHSLWCCDRLRLSFSHTVEYWGICPRVQDLPEKNRLRIVQTDPPRKKYWQVPLNKSTHQPTLAKEALTVIQILTPVKVTFDPESQQGLYPDISEDSG